MFRIGHGYDVHKFSSELKPLIIGGVVVDRTLGVEAHSDGDVLYHALCDALLGAIAQRDIGFHFPDIDDSNKNRNSADFIKYAQELIFKQGYSLSNLDITLVAQKPKLMNFIVNIQQSIATTLNIDVNQVNVKATTTEKLGFIGREEGIAAYAVVLLYKKSEV